jgi:thymidylate synthase (FAD)
MSNLDRLSEEQQQEITAARQQTFQTHRPTVPALEEILFHAFPVLDHGFVRVVDYLGDDNAVTQAARVSYGRGTKKLSDDAALLRFMKRHGHTSAFEMAEIKYHIKLPIFVARQWIRHRTAGVNELSARYSVMDKEFYIPEPEQLAAQSTTNRQGRGEVVTPELAKIIQDLLIQDATHNHDDYEWLLNEPGSEEHDPNRPGLARELARMNLTLNTYTQWYWKCDLHNLFHFLKLRADSHAQYEIRSYAEVMLDILRKWVPISTQAFIDYQHSAHTFSRMDMNVIRRLVADLVHTQSSDSSLLRSLSAANGDPVAEKKLAGELEMSVRELRELVVALFHKK